MATTTIRFASPSDRGRLAQLRQAYAEEQKDLPADDPGFVDRFGAWYLATASVSRWQVAEVDREIVGMAHMFTHVRMPLPSYDPGGWGYLSLLYVAPTHRGAGLGRRLIQAMEEGAVRLGFSKVLLNPTEKATPLYRRCGYEPADSHLVRTMPEPGRHR